MANLVPVQIKGNVGTIEDNLNIVEASVRETIAEYSKIIVTEDTVAAGKKFLAAIRKEKKELDDERKAIKRKWMEPYEAFEKRAKQIIALYDEPAKIINEQLDGYEEDRRRIKKQEIQNIYDSVKEDLGEWLPFARIYNAKWENATYSAKNIREDMKLLFDQMKLSISTIESLHSEFEADALCVLKETGSLQSAIAEINDLQKQKERFMEQARQEAERERLEKEKVSAEEVKPEPFTPTETVEEAERPAFRLPEEEISEAPFAMEKTLKVIVKVGESDFDKLRGFLEANGLEYEVM